jgi:hypothetical protein
MIKLNAASGQVFDGSTNAVEPILMDTFMTYKSVTDFTVENLILSGAPEYVFKGQTDGCVKFGYKGYFAHVSGQRMEAHVFIEESTNTTTWTSVPYTETVAQDFLDQNKDDYCGTVLPVDIASGTFYRLSVQLPSPADANDIVALETDQTFFWAEKL